ncbi:hypothetical protein V6N13_088377 [Hibiscus sabdariffa]|uniref:Uncharacterized protein n=1 Tax=Hibiscus sabdariffa TaxID=183260 RepID=A0ABR2FZL0_9ROSI
MEANSCLLIIFLVSTLLVSHGSSRVDAALEPVPVPKLYPRGCGRGRGFPFEFRTVSKRIINAQHRPSSPLINALRHHVFPVERNPHWRAPPYPSPALLPPPPAPPLPSPVPPLPSLADLPPPSMST